MVTLTMYLCLLSYLLDRVLVPLGFSLAGASTPYKRWSKCTVEKVGEAFLQKLRGELMHLFIATRGEIFSLKFTKYRLAAGLCPDPLGELNRSPQT